MHLPACVGKVPIFIRCVSVLGSIASDVCCPDCETDIEFDGGGLVLVPASGFFGDLLAALLPGPGPGT